jgi:uncharacterized surface protein with fasciclin (FAS1) repeats
MTGRFTGLVAGAAAALTIGTTAARASDVVDTAVAAGNFTTLAAALEAGGLVETLKGQGPFTVFAPTDEAFAKLPPGTVESLLEPANKDKLVAILTYHVVPGNLPASEVVKYDAAETVNGARLDIDAGSSGVKVNDANVTATDIMADNGVIHVIDAVVLPPEQ